jgi:tetratricopeptide (TPR) repeat protein
VNHCRGVSALLLVILAPILLLRCASTGGLAPPDTYESPERAIQAYQKAIEQNPNDARAYMWLGFAELTMDNKADAVGHLTTAVELDPSLADAFLKLGELEEEEGRFARALALYSDAIEGNPVINELLERKNTIEEMRQASLSRLDNANALLVAGDYEEARSIIQEVNQELPMDPRPKQLLARVYVEIAKTKLAYAERKDLFNKASDALEQARELGGNGAYAALRASIAELLTEDENQVAQARESIEAGGGVFSRQVCLGQKAPLLQIKNNSGSPLSLDLKFTDDVRQWVVAADYVSLRSGPGTEFDRIGHVSRGTIVWIRQAAGGEFVSVVTPDGEGWISRRLLDRERIVRVHLAPWQTEEVMLTAGTADFRLGRGIRTLAEGREQFLPYLCYSWP